MSSDILVVTSNDVANARIARVLAPVFGSAVRSRNVIGNKLGNIRAAFGGSQTGYMEMLNATRNEAISALQAHAASYGANAVIAMRFDSGEFDAGENQSMAEITAYGTAVILESLS